MRERGFDPRVKRYEVQPALDRGSDDTTFQTGKAQNHGNCHAEREASDVAPEGDEDLLNG